MTDENEDVTADPEGETQPTGVRRRKRKAKDETPPPAPEAKASGEYVVAKHKAITTRRGMRGEGTAIKADDLPGGQAAFDHLVSEGTLVPS